MDRGELFLIYAIPPAIAEAATWMVSSKPAGWVTERLHRLFSFVTRPPVAGRCAPLPRKPAGFRSGRDGRPWG